MDTNIERQHVPVSLEFQLVVVTPTPPRRCAPQFVLLTLEPQLLPGALYFV